MVNYDTDNAGADALDVCSTSTELGHLLECDDIQPGQAAGYQLCKTIYLYHPLGGKLVDQPVNMAMSDRRTVHINDTFSLEQHLRDAFEREWKALGADRNIKNAARIARVYGVSAIAMLVNGEEPKTALDYATLYNKSVSFNILDPLNTAGSIVLNQDANADDFQKVDGITVAGKPYHKSRCQVIQNGDPIYLAYNAAAFGFSGRSVYQRALYPLKSFVNTMRTDEMVAVKAGVLVTKINSGSSVVNKAMQKLGSFKRNLLKIARTGNVLQIGETDTIESIDLKNLEGPLDSVRKHILENIAASADMPAVLVNSETFAQGFGEGSEDAKQVAVYIDGVREWMEPLYDYFVRICQYRAWSPEFYEAMKTRFEFNDEYNASFAKWTNNFEFRWPSTLKEPESERVKVDEIRFKAIIGMGQTLLPQLTADDANRAVLIDWLQQNANANERLFPQRLDLDYDSLLANPPAAAVSPDEGSEGGF